MFVRWWAAMVIAGVILAQAGPATAGEEKSELPKGIKDLQIGALWYLTYQNGESDGEDYNKFTIRRGYINIKKKMAPWLDTRITPDVTQDDSGDIRPVNVRLGIGDDQYTQIQGRDIGEGTVVVTKMRMPRG